MNHQTPCRLLPTALAVLWSVCLPGQEDAAVAAPRLVVTRHDAAPAQAWRPGSPLMFEVELGHPCMAGALLRENFVLDPDGGYAQAIELVVTDRDGAVVPMSFLRRGGGDAGALTLHRFERRTLWFELEQGKPPVAVSAGELQVVARLHTTTGRWKGTATSKPLTLEVANAAALELTLRAEGTLRRGWPAFVSVLLSVPEDGEPVPVPLQNKDWPTAVPLTLLSERGVVVEGATRQLPVVPPRSGRLEPGTTFVVQFHVPAATTATLAEGSYQWRVTFRADPTQDPGAAPRPGGSDLTTANAVCRCVATPDPLPAELHWLHERALVRGDLAEGLALRAEAERPVGYLGDRRRIAERAAAPFAAAERRAIAYVKAHPDDEAACLLLAEVLAAAADPIAARLFAGRAVAVELERRRAAATAAGQDEAQQEPSLELALLGETIVRGVRPLDPDIVAAFQDALATLRRGEGAAASDVAATGAPPAPPAVPSEAPLAKEPAASVAGAVTNGDAATLDAQFTADANGQWATTAVASSQYSTDNYSAARATGAPDVPQHGDHTNAWAPGSADSGAERLTLSFARAAPATAVRVRQSCTPGAITRVELVGTGGGRLVVFEGVDSGTYAANTIGWFVVTFPATAFSVAKVELGLDTKRVAGWNEIDAVQLVGDPGKR